MKTVSIKFVFITCIITFVVISVVWTFNDLKSQIAILGAIIFDPLYNILNDSFELASSGDSPTNFELEYSAQEHASDILKNYFILVKDSFGLISLYTSGLTFIICSFQSFSSSDSEADSNLIVSFLKFIKKLL